MAGRQSKGKITEGYVCQEYMRANLNGEKKLKHRLIWEEHNGKIPKGFVVHHIDENKLNNDINNLELKSLKKHSSEHSRYFDYKYVKKLREDGLTLQQIADKIGTKSTGTVHYILNPRYNGNG